MNGTELALKFGGKYGSKEYYTIIHILNYVKKEDLKEVEKILNRLNN